jgi:hypothetical protein
MKNYMSYSEETYRVQLTEEELCVVLDVLEKAPIILTLPERDKNVIDWVCEKLKRLTRCD